MNTHKRPWGEFQVIFEQSKCKVKKLILLPGKKISLQLNNHRSEVWQIIKGKALVTVQPSIFIAEEGKVIIIPIKNIHRLENIGKEDLQIIEIQHGDYLSEDDIERFDDDYGRI